MNLALEGRVAAVFGAARGIGAAIAGAFLAEGAYVAAIDRDPGVIERQAADDRSCSRSRSLGLVADVTDHAAVGRAVDSVLERFGRCDHVVFAAGAGSGKFGFPFWKYAFHLTTSTSAIYGARVR
jgi:NAD(P)-dependent dehydrogenase (short-subunit alcohol dehydrogenase family)